MTATDSTEPTTAARPTRRERLRVETAADIKRWALLAIERDGAPALSVRAVAREMGMVPSALYRYYPSREAILSALIVDAYNDLGEVVEQAVAAVDPAAPFDAWMAAARATRTWGLAEPNRWGLLYGTPIPGYEAEVDLVTAPAMRITHALTWILINGVVQGRLDSRSLARSEAEMAPDLVGQVAVMVASQGIPVPVALMVEGISAWSQLIGIVSFEVFGHLGKAVPDASGLFELQAARIGRSLSFREPRRTRGSAG